MFIQICLKNVEMAQITNINHDDNFIIIVFFKKPILEEQLKINRVSKSQSYITQEK